MRDLHCVEINPGEGFEDIENNEERTYSRLDLRHLRKEPYRMVLLGDLTLRLNDYQDAQAPMGTK